MVAKSHTSIVLLTSLSYERMMWGYRIVYFKRRMHIELLTFEYFFP